MHFLLSPHQFITNNLLSDVTIRSSRVNVHLFHYRQLSLTSRKCDLKQVEGIMTGRESI